MVDNNTMTQAEILAANGWVADLCPFVLSMQVPDPKVHENCCQGTSKRHPEFWERCLSLPPAFKWNPDTWSHKNCASCDGSGWVLAVLVEKVLDALLKEYGEVDFYLRDSGKYWVVCGGVQYEGVTLLAAALDALRQLEVAKGVPEQPLRKLL